MLSLTCMDGNTTIFHKTKVKHMASVSPAHTTNCLTRRRQRDLIKISDRRAMIKTQLCLFVFLCICVELTMISKVLRAVIIGPPGSGKHTISYRIVKDFDKVHLSSGDILREHILNQTGDVDKFLDLRGHLWSDIGCTYH